MSSAEKARALVYRLEEFLDARACSGRSDYLYNQYIASREMLILALDVALSEASGKTLEISKVEKLNETNQS